MVSTTATAASKLTWFSVIVSIASLGMLMYSINISHSLHAQQLEVQSHLRQLHTDLSTLDKVTEKVARLERIEMEGATTIKNKLNDHSIQINEHTARLTKQFGELSEKLALLVREAVTSTKLSSPSSQEATPNPVVPDNPVVPELPKWRLLTILAQALENVKPANSPYVPEEQKTSINQVADSLGGKENGCRESVYGELPTTSVVHILNALALTKEDVFYDLGAGRGHVVATAFYSFLTKRAYGIEMSSKRVELACDFFAHLRLKMPPSVESDKPTRSIQIAEGNFLELDISDGTVFYLTATCFRPTLMYQISKRLLKLAEKSGRAIRVAAVSERFPNLNNDFNYTSEERLRIMKSATEQVASDWTNATEINFYTFVPSFGSQVAIAPQSNPEPPNAPVKSCKNAATEFQSYPYEFTTLPK